MNREEIRDQIISEIGPGPLRTNTVLYVSKTAIKPYLVGNLTEYYVNHKGPHDKIVGRETFVREGKKWKKVEIKVLFVEAGESFYIMNVKGFPMFENHLKDIVDSMSGRCYIMGSQLWLEDHDDAVMIKFLIS